MTAIKRSVVDQPVSIIPLVTFRITFGLLMFVSILRFMWRGWIDTVYIQPKFHFTYMGFEWVQPFGRTGMYLLFVLMVLATLCITLGLFYRIATVLFFTAFTYVELIDVTTYLNHYYFISLIAFIMIWLPANRQYALDLWRKRDAEKTMVPAWNIGILRFQIAVVYIFAGLAKLNADWLLHAEPMRTWLPSKSHLPVIGPLLYEEWVAYLFSWFGAVYDLLIVFFLLNKKTRPVAFIFVLVFHICTAIFFPAIGMFPYVMMVSSLIFFPASFHDKVLSVLPFYKKNKPFSYLPGSIYHYSQKAALHIGAAVYIFFQLIIPLRFLVYPDRLFWSEEGYRFSWRVMLMEKAGSAYFTVKDQTAKQTYVVNNSEFLTPLQEKMMSTQPDMILKYAHFVAKKYSERGVDQPKVFGEIYVALNGERSRLFIDSTVNLAAEPLSWKHYQWILPYNKR